MTLIWQAVAVDKAVGSGAFKEIAFELMWPILCHCLSHAATIDATNGGKVNSDGTDLAFLLSSGDSKFGFS